MDLPKKLVKKWIGLFIIVFVLLMIHIWLTSGFGVIQRKWLIYKNDISCAHDLHLQNTSNDFVLGIIVHGRLSNWMFQFASLVGIAAMNKRQPYLIPDHPLTYIFDIDRSKVKYRHSMCDKIIAEDRPIAYDAKMEKLPYENLNINGYLQSWRYFKRRENLVRINLTFKAHIIKDAAKIYKRLTAPFSKGWIFVSIHVRRADMLHEQSIQEGYCVAPASYIVNAMDHYRKKLNNVTFIVCTDDQTWCRNNIAFSDVIFANHNRDVIDLAILSFANHSIITVGTFGWWGAWLAGGDVVYYRDSPTNGSKIAQGMNRDDYYPQEWIGLGG